MFPHWLCLKPLGKKASKPGYASHFQQTSCVYPGAEYLNLIETLTKNKPHSILQRDAPPCIFLENDTYCSRTMNPNTPQSFEGLLEHQSRPRSVDCYLTSTSKSICGGTSKTSIPGISRSSVEHCQIVPVCVHAVIKIQRVK